MIICSFLGGHNTPVSPGHISPEITGHIVPVWGGHIDRFFQLNSTLRQKKCRIKRYSIFKYYQDFLFFHFNHLELNINDRFVIFTCLKHILIIFFIVPVNDHFARTTLLNSFNFLKYIQDAF